MFTEVFLNPEYFHFSNYRKYNFVNLNDIIHIIIFRLYIYEQQLFVTLLTCLYEKVLIGLTNIINIAKVSHNRQFTSCSC